MPPARRSRSRSTTVAPVRPLSSNSTASLHSYHSRMVSQEPGAPYPAPRAIRPSGVIHPLAEQTQIIPVNHDMTGLLHGGNIGEMSQTPMDLQMNSNTRMLSQPHSQQHHHHHPHQQQLQHQQQPQQFMPQYSQAVEFNASQQMQFNPQMEYHARNMQPHTMIVTTIPQMEQEIRKPRQSAGPNENELNEMLDRNIHRSLDDLAAAVRANEKTSSAEKTKQLFAMLWLKRNLVQAKGSVPRTRVHTQYTSRCAQHHLQPLNPASFGKLVRVIYPDIATRRLGVRGESKYHYVNLTLVEDGKDGGPHKCGHTGSWPPSMTLESNVNLESESAVAPVEAQSIASPTQPISHPIPVSEGRVFPNPQEPVFAPSRLTGTRSYSHRLKFPSTRVMQATVQEEIALPDIFSYAPAKTDVDAANALSTLYFSHVTSLVDCVRYCKDKNFFRFFTQFQGTLTVPVQKLLIHPSISPWVKECDYIMYQQMIKTTAPLTLQVLPHKVIKFFDTVSQCLDQHLSKTFASLPKHVLDARLEPATIFSQLLNRMLRVNQAAHAAGVVLIDQGNRDRMWTEMVKFVQPKCMMNAFIPDCGYDEEVYKILTIDVRQLLLPLATHPGLENGTHYEIAAYTQNGHSAPTESFQLDKLCVFLEGLRSRFPTVSSHNLIHYVQGITSGILRDIVMQAGVSYNPWLITKCYIDELALWLAHVGGFLERKSPYEALRAEQKANGNSDFTASGINGANNDEGSGHNSRYSSTPSELGDAAHSGVFQGTRAGTQSRPAHAAGALLAPHPGGFAVPTHPNNTRHASIAPSTNAHPSEQYSHIPINTDDAMDDDQRTTDLELDDSGIGLSMLGESLDGKVNHDIQHSFIASHVTSNELDHYVR